MKKLRKQALEDGTLVFNAGSTSSGHDADKTLAKRMAVQSQRLLPSARLLPAKMEPRRKKQRVEKPRSRLKFQKRIVQRIECVSLTTGLPVAEDLIDSSTLHSCMAFVSRSPSSCFIIIHTLDLALSSILTAHLHRSLTTALHTATISQHFSQPLISAPPFTPHHKSSFTCSADIGMLTWRL